MKKPCVLRGILGNQSGIVLPLVLVFLALGMLLLTPMLALATTSLSTGSLYEDKTREIHAADAGLELGIHRLIVDGMEDEDLDGVLDTIVLTDAINECSVVVTVSDTGQYTDDAVPAPIYHIRSFAQRMGTDSGTTVDAYVSGISFTTAASLGELAVSQTGPDKRKIVEDGIVEADLGILSSNYDIYSVVIFAGSVQKVTGDIDVTGTVVFLQPVNEFQGSAGSDGTVAFCNQGDTTLTYQGGVESTGVLYVNGDLHFQSTVDPITGLVIVIGDITSQVANTIDGYICCTGEIGENVTYDPDKRTTSCSEYYTAYCLLDTADFKTISYIVE